MNARDSSSIVAPNIEMSGRVGQVIKVRRAELVTPEKGCGQLVAHVHVCPVDDCRNLCVYSRWVLSNLSINLTTDYDWLSALSGGEDNGYLLVRILPNNLVNQSF